MDRRTKIILLSIGSALLLGVVIWFVIWPLLKPVLPQIKKAQPPAVEQQAQQNPSSNTPSTGIPTAPTFTYNPSDYPDADRIADMGRRAGVFSETMESGSSQKQFENIALAASDASPKFADVLKTKQSEMQKAHPKTGPLYLTIARRLVEKPENDLTISGDTFTVKVQMQVQVTDGDKKSVEYKESTVTFTNVDGQWLLSGYEVKPYNL